jgi:methionine--tRNA ligase beta chain
MTVSFDDFQELDIQIGTVQSVSDHPNADNLLLMDVDLGEPETRQLVAGIKDDYDPEDVEGRQIVVVTNLEEATIRGEKSEGMLLAADADRGIALLQPDKSVKNGTPVR